MEYDPFAFVDLDEEADPILVRERAIAHARTLDPHVIVCVGCKAKTEDWITRNGLTGEGVCRACMKMREADRERSKAFTSTFHKALEALQKLRKERDERIKKEIANVPF